MILSPQFYQRDDVVQVSKDLLGKVLYTKIDGLLTAGRIVETEAYRGPDDKACHAYQNKYTARTKTMFAEGGTLYVYISYGVHPMINVVTSRKGEAHAVLIRAIEPILGIDQMLLRRSHAELQISTANGPGKTATALGVQKKHDGSILYKSESGIWIEESSEVVPTLQIYGGPRVGMSIHTGRDAHRPWRFYIKDSRWVSNPKQARYPNNPPL